MKTTLKTAKFTLKTAVTRCIATNAVAVSCIFVAKVAKWWCDFGGFHVFFRRLQGLFAVKMRCENGENMVRKRRNGYALQRVDAWFTAFLFQKVAKWWCDFGECVVVCGDCYVLFR